MKEVILYSVLLIAVAVYGAINALRFMFSESFRTKYFQKNTSKTYLWKKWLGEEKAAKLTQKVFAPIGLVLCIFYLLFAVSNLYLVFIH